MNTLRQAYRIGLFTGIGWTMLVVGLAFGLAFLVGWFRGVLMVLP